MDETILVRNREEEQKFIGNFFFIRAKSGEQPKEYGMKNRQSLLKIHEGILTLINALFIVFHEHSTANTDFCCYKLFRIYFFVNPNKAAKAERKKKLLKPLVWGYHEMELLCDAMRWPENR